MAQNQNKQNNEMGIFLLLILLCHIKREAKNFKAVLLKMAFACMCYFWKFPHEIRQQAINIFFSTENANRIICVSGNTWSFAPFSACCSNRRVSDKSLILSHVVVLRLWLQDWKLLWTEETWNLRSLKFGRESTKNPTNLRLKGFEN